MTQLDVPKLVAGCCGLAAFAIAIIAGLAADNAVDTIASRALLSLVICFVMGGVIGMVAESAIREATEPIADALSPEPARPAAPEGEHVEKSARLHEGPLT